MAVERLRTCDDIDELAQELGVTRRCLYKWRVKLETIEREKMPRGPALTRRPTVSKFTS
jgi:Helix-turn-helix domain